MVNYYGKATPASGSGGGSITVDQTYDATSPNAQSGTAVAEAVATVSSDGLHNTATGTDSLTILGTAATSNNALNIGVGTTATAQGIALGSGTENHVDTNYYGTNAGNSSIAIGYIAEADTGISIGSFAMSSNGGIAIGSSFSEEGYQDYNNADTGIAIGNCAKSRNGGIAIGSGSGSLEEGYNYNDADDGIAIGNCASAEGSIVIGAYSSAFGGSIVIGNSATENGLNRMILIGNGAEPVNSNGNPSPGYQFVIGSGERDSQTDKFINYLMLDLRTGKIPNDRINGVSGSFTSQDGKTVTVTNGVITSIV